MNYFTDIGSVREILAKLSEAPESQVTDRFRKELSKLSSLENLRAQDIKYALDECVHSALASDFVVNVLDIAHRQLVSWENHG